MSDVNQDCCLIVAGITQVVRTVEHVRLFRSFHPWPMSDSDLAFAHYLYEHITATVGWERDKLCSDLASEFSIAKTKLVRDTKCLDIFSLAKLVYVFCHHAPFANVTQLALLQSKLALFFRSKEPNDSHLPIPSMNNANVLDLINVQVHYLYPQQMFSETVSVEQQPSAMHDDDDDDDDDDDVDSMSARAAPSFQQGQVPVEDVRAQNNIMDQDAVDHQDQHSQVPPDASVQQKDENDDKEEDRQTGKRIKANDDSYIKVRPLTDKRQALLVECNTILSRTQRYILDPQVSPAFKQACLALLSAATSFRDGQHLSKGQAIDMARATIVKTEKAAGLGKSALEHLWERMANIDLADPSSQRGKHINPNACELDNYPQLGIDLKAWCDENQAGKKSVNPIMDNIVAYVNDFLVPLHKVNRSEAHAGQPFSTTCIRDYLERIGIDKELRKKRFTDPRIDPRNIEENKGIYDVLAPAMRHMIQSSADWHNLVKHRILPSYVAEETKQEWDDVCTKLDRGDVLEEVPNFVGFIGRDPLIIHADVHSFSSQQEDYADVDLTICPKCKIEDAADYSGEDDPVCDRCRRGFHLKCAKLKKPPAEDEDWFCIDCLEFMNLPASSKTSTEIVKEIVRTQRAWYLKRKALNESNNPKRPAITIPDKHPLLYMKNKVSIVINVDESNLNAGEVSRWVWKSKNTPTDRQASNLKSSSVQVTVGACTAASNNVVLPVDILDLKKHGYNDQDYSMIYYRQMYENAHSEFPPSLCNLIVALDHSSVPGSASRNHLDLDKLNHRLVTKAKNPPFYAPTTYVDIDDPDYVKDDLSTHKKYCQDLMYGSEPELADHGGDDLGRPKTQVSILAERKGMTEAAVLEKWPTKALTMAELRKYADVEQANQLWCFKMAAEFGRKAVRTMKGCPAASFIEYAWRGHKSFVRRNNRFKTVSHVTELTLRYFNDVYSKINLLRTTNHCLKVLETVKDNDFTCTQAMASHVVVSRSRVLLADLLEVPEDELSDSDDDEEVHRASIEADFVEDNEIQDD